ncbi:ParB/RepB/Spo0J family partition protein [Ideonella benzenivorans]|uniref:ParB/RepB/Spo0J family partition protein n=1 Tax=Ideonella benzenivorans TaxID=2831643 RepID=UPI001CEC4022|nr:ParB/RepB/Spo0J family partition protein [Ideonella benzenivorans]
MSTKNKLLAMTMGLDPMAQAPAEPAVSRAPGAPAILPPPAEGSLPAQKFPQLGPGSAPRTGPGQMLQFRGQMLAIEGELAKARSELQLHEGSTPTRLIDPALIDGSRWANRHPDAFNRPEFESLKQDIAHAGGNVQPILVRQAAGQEGRYEVVFGHRRHRACLELGVPVLAMVTTSPLSDAELFAAMDRENRERADLSPYEQGTMYRRALDAGLYPSNRRMAEALGVSHTWVANVLSVADLPAPVLECFRSPLEVQHRHAKAISEALERDRKAVLRRAEKLRQAPAKLAPTAVVAALIKSDAGQADGGRQSLKLGQRDVGTWQRDRAGRLTIQLDAAAVPADKVEAVLAAFTKALESVN